MIYLTSFATNNCLISQKELEYSALNYGVNSIFSFSPENIDKNFINKNNHILNNFNSRGAGYWLWKPYIILESLKKINYGDFLLYSDVGVTIINDVKELIDEEDIKLFKVHNCLIKSYTKKDCIIALDASHLLEHELTNGAFQFYRKTDFSIKFLEEYLFLCEKDTILDDSNIEPNEPYFIDHRHDQSILSILRLKKDIQIYRDPSQYGNSFQMTNSNYRQIFNHHRNKR